MPHLQLPGSPDGVAPLDLGTLGILRLEQPIVLVAPPGHAALQVPAV